MGGRGQHSQEAALSLINHHWRSPTSKFAFKRDAPSPHTKSCNATLNMERRINHRAPPLKSRALPAKENHSINWKMKPPRGLSCRRRKSRKNCENMRVFYLMSRILYYPQGSFPIIWTTIN